MATIKKLIKTGLKGTRNVVPTNPAIKNSQKATTYVGKGVLRNGGGITPVPNGPLIKKKGPFKGSTLKKGGVVKAQGGKIISYSTPAQTKMTVTPATPVTDESKQTPAPPMPPKKRANWHYAGARGPVWDESGQPLTEAEYDKVMSPEQKRKGGAIKRSKLKNGGKMMLKRKDGSVSQRGLWDNIRANKGSGKKPTAEMLKQEKKIKQAKNGAWQRKEGKNPSGGLNAKGVASYRAENPGSKLKMAVTTPPSKLKPGSKSAKRRKSFCARMSGVSGPMKKPNGKPTRKALSLRKWNC